MRLRSDGESFVLHARLHSNAIQTVKLFALAASVAGSAPRGARDALLGTFPVTDANGLADEVGSLLGALRSAEAVLDACLAEESSPPIDCAQHSETVAV